MAVTKSFQRTAAFLRHVIMLVDTDCTTGWFVLVVLAAEHQPPSKKFTQLTAAQVEVSMDVSNELRNIHTITLLIIKVNIIKADYNHVLESS